MLPPVQTPPADLRSQALAVAAGWAAQHGLETVACATADLAVRSGSALVFVTVLVDPPLVTVSSPLVTEIGFDPMLHRELGHLTRRMLIGRIYHAKHTIWASCPVFGRPFQPEHLLTALSLMAGLADDLDDRLVKRFGGRRSRGDEEGPPAVPHGERIGMYL